LGIIFTYLKLNLWVEFTIPKKTDSDTIDNQYVELIQNKLNNRPRKKLGFATPNEYFLRSLQNRVIDSEVAFVT